MWYLLVAAGAGYLATKWQSGQKPCSLSAQNTQASSPSSVPNKPSRESSSSQLQSSCGNGFTSFPENEIPWTCPGIVSNRITSTNAAGNLDDKEKLLEDDDGSPSPSSCCSSNSTVVNSPVHTISILRKSNGALEVQGKESGSQPMSQNGVFRFQGMAKTPQSSHLHELRHQDSGLSCNGSLRKESPHAISTKRQHYPVDSNCCNETLLDHVAVAKGLNSTAVVASNDAVHAKGRITSDAGIDASFTGIDASFTLTGKRQRDSPRPVHLSDEYGCTPSSRFNTRQGICRSITSRSGSTFCDVRSKITADSMDRADSNAFVGFGLAMAVCFMVSSSKKEMEKMGEVLRETEDLVYDMRKELEERNLYSSMNEDNEEFFTIKPEDAIYQQGCTAEEVVNRMDARLTDGFCFHKDECIGSDGINKADKKHDLEENHEVDLENLDMGCERRHKNAERGGMNSTWQGNSCHFKEETDLEECEDDCTMPMIELERKLWQVFQERQEERIVELEAALEVTMSKLHVQEEELHWWKNRASWLMQQCFGSASDGLDLPDPFQNVEGFDFTNDEGIKDDPQPSSNQTNLPVVEGFMEAVPVKTLH